ncbi:hypothetical protein GCM10010505_08750 [Kitasatospora aburaviensis]
MCTPRMCLARVRPAGRPPCGGRDRDRPATDRAARAARPLPAVHAHPAIIPPTGAAASGTGERGHGAQCGGRAEWWCEAWRCEAMRCGAGRCRAWSREEWLREGFSGRSSYCTLRQ